MNIWPIIVSSAKPMVIHHPQNSPLAKLLRFLCFLMKWTTTILALSSAIPAGVVAPTMIIGGLLGRVWGHVILPAWLVDLLLSKNGAFGLS